MLNDEMMHGHDTSGNGAVLALASTLRAAREAAGYSILDLSETCGLTVDEISGVEDGSIDDSDKIARIAAVLKVSTGDLK